MPHPRGSPVVQASPCPRYRLNFLQRQPGAVRPKRCPRRAVDHAARQAPADRRVIRTVANAVGATTQFQGLNFWRLSNPSRPRSLAGLGVRISALLTRPAMLHSPYPLAYTAMVGWPQPRRDYRTRLAVLQRPHRPLACIHRRLWSPIWTRYRGWLVLSRRHLDPLGPMPQPRMRMRMRTSWLVFNGYPFLKPNYAWSRGTWYGSWVSLLRQNPLRRSARHSRGSRARLWGPPTFFLQCPWIAFASTLHPRQVAGLWGSEHRSAHIKILEMLAVSNALQHFRSDILGRAVLVQCDNATVVAYINHQGGNRSGRLCVLAWDLIHWCIRHGVTLSAVRRT